MKQFRYHSVCGHLLKSRKKGYGKNEQTNVAPASAVEEAETNSTSFSLSKETSADEYAEPAPLVAIDTNDRMSKAG